MVSESSGASLEVAIKRAVRGEISWRDLAQSGIAVRVTETGVQEFSGLGHPVRVAAEDIAWGWLRTSANENTFRDWARLVHGAVGMVELDVERHPLGEQVLDALWHAAFGDPVTQEMTDVMRRILSS
jgi:hypothetical protein